MTMNIKYSKNEKVDGTDHKYTDEWAESESSEGWIYSVTGELHELLGDM